MTSSPAEPSGPPTGRRSPTWTGRRHVPPDLVSSYSPWLRLHDHLALRYGIRADRPRRWERPEADDVTNLPVLLRQASAVIDLDVARATASTGHPMVPDAVDLLRRVRTKPSAGVNLAEYLHVSPQRVSRLVDQLERAGLVTREPGWHDLRTRRVSVTDAGLDILDALDAAMVDHTELWFEGLDALETEALLRILRALADEP